jgi:uncharacterized membrane protein YdfJ with MMPL/SSD domain
VERWTRLMIRCRWAVVAAWLVVLLFGGYSATRLSALLSNDFTMPGTDSERRTRGIPPCACGFSSGWPLPPG